jgi:hypothetical protein
LLLVYASISGLALPKPALTDEIPWQ